MAGIRELEEKIKNDEAFRSDLQHSSDAKDLLSKIKEAGFDVTPEELVKTSKKGAEGSVSDEDLDSVAGGGNFFDDFWEGFKFGLVHPIDSIGFLIDQI